MLVSNGYFIDKIEFTSYWRLVTSAEGKSKTSGKREGITRQSESRAGSTNALQVWAAENRSFLFWATVCEPGSRSKCWNIKLRISWFMSASGVWKTRLCGSGNRVREHSMTTKYKSIPPGIGLDAWALVLILFPSYEISPLNLKQGQVVEPYS